MKKQKSNKGITLIALIITIIILLILAMVSIKLIINSGIINRAEQGVNKYSLEEIREKIQLAYTDYQMGKLSDKNYTFKQALTNGGVQYISVTETDNEGYIVTVETKDGQRQFSVSASGIEKLKELADYGLKLGDYVNYDPTKDTNGNTITAQYTSYAKSHASANVNNGRTSGYTSDQTFSVNATTGGWRVFGTENGKILLVSADPVNTTSGSDYHIIGKEGYIYGIDELNAICAIYGKGKGASSARSMTTSDVNNLLGYDPATYSGYGTTYKYRRASSYYTYNSTKNYYVEYSTDGGTSWTKTDNYNTFNYFDGEKFVNLGSNQTIDVTNTQYVYSLGTVDKYGTVEGSLTLEGTDPTKGVPQYWLATRGTSPNLNGKILYNLEFAGSACVNPYQNNIYINDDSTTYSYSAGIRPMVVLDSNVSIDTSSTSKDGSSASSAWEIK